MQRPSSSVPRCLLVVGTGVFPSLPHSLALHSQSDSSDESVLLSSFPAKTIIKYEINRKKNTLRMTANVLKQDLNTQTVKKNANLTN